MGSLFKTRDLWRVTFDPSEEFDVRSMVLANVDNDPSGEEKIVVGSFQGILRVLLPKQKGYKADDLLLELNVGVPILQVACGRFTPRTSGVCLALLTPKRLQVGIVTNQSARPASDSAAGASSDPLSRQLAWKMEYEHVLEHTPYNFIYGAFGGSGSAEIICVQSMDGQLLFLDHTKVLFARFLPSSYFLCPGPLLYCPVSDSILTNTSTLELVAYRYTSLAQSTASETKEGKEGRKLSAEWSFNLGEDCIDMCVCRLTRNLPNQQVDIVVLCEKTLFVLKDNGEMRFNKRLDFPGASLTPYLLPDNRTHNILIGTFAPSIFVHNDAKVLWAAKAAATPLRVIVSKACQTEGSIVILADDNSASVNYLGTDPASNPIQPLESKELDYEAMDEEHRRLQQVIRQALSSGKSEPVQVLHMAFDPPTAVSPQHESQISLQLSYSGSETLDNITITVQASAPITADPKSYCIPTLPHGEQAIVPISFTICAEGEKMSTPTSLLAEIVACYTSPTGEPLTARSSFLLPLPLVGAVIPPAKNTNFEMQIDTNKAPVPLSALFSDLAATSSDVAANALSFQYVSGTDVTVLVSKNAGKYKIFATNIEALWLMTSELTRRIRQACRPRPGEEELHIDFPAELPLEDYFTCIDAHFEARKNLQAEQNKLGEIAHQFRAIQKRLLVRFREKTPSAVSSLESLFEDTYRKLHIHADKVEVAQNALQHRSNVLVCCTHLMLLITRYKYQATFTKDDFEQFRFYLTPVVANNNTQGWEETTDAAMMHLLRTALSKNAKESATVPLPIVFPPDTTKLKKHISLVFDRIAKGASLTKEPAAANTNSKTWEVQAKPKKGGEAPAA